MEHRWKSFFFQLAIKLGVRGCVFFTCYYFLIWFLYINPGLPPYKRYGTHKKPYMVFYKNKKFIEISIEMYGDIQVIKKT